MNIQNFLEDYAKSRQLCGTIMVSKNSEIIAGQNFGFADNSETIKCHTNTQYLIGSVTKQFTAAALLRALYDDTIASGLTKDKDNVPALEKSILEKLNQPISNYLHPDHKIWTENMPSWANTISAHQLLIHSSGITNYTSLPEFKDIFLNPPEMPALVSTFKDKDLDFQIGSKHSYSNSGYLLLGEIIQQITNQPLDVYLEQTFFNPLNMFATFLATKGTVDDLKKMDSFKNLARGYEVDIRSENPTVSEVEKYCSMQIPGAAGSIVSTAPDLLLWNSALYTGKVLPSFLLNLMLKPHIRVNDCTNDAYGYGIEVVANQALGTIYFHGGSIDGFIARLVYIPSLKLTIVCLSNVAKNLEKLEPEINELKKQLPKDINPNEAFKILEEELNKKFPGIIKNKDRYFTTEFAANLINALSENREDIVNPSLF